MQLYLTPVPPSSIVLQPTIIAIHVRISSIYIIQFVCLFVRDSRLNYAKKSYQSLRNYRKLPGRTTPRIGVTRHVDSMAFPVYFRYSLRGRTPYSNYRFVGFPVYARVATPAAYKKRNNMIPNVYTCRQKDKT